MNQTSMTALMSCYVRAYHMTETPPEHRILEDPMAVQMLTPEEYGTISGHLTEGIHFFDPGFQGSGTEALQRIVNGQLAPSVLGRSAFAAAALDLARQRGVRQYLLLAAGYDTSAYRRPDLTVFELDRPEMTADKQRRLDRAGIDRSHVRFVSADLTDPGWPAALCRAGFDTGAPVFCSLLGISYYLTREAFSTVLQQLSGLISAGSEVVFDYPMARETAQEQLNRQLAQAAHEQMKARYTLPELELLLQDCRMLLYEHLTPGDMERRFFAPCNAAVPPYSITAPGGVAYCLAVRSRS